MGIWTTQHQRKTLTLVNVIIFMHHLFFCCVFCCILALRFRSIRNIQSNVSSVGRAGASINVLHLFHYNNRKPCRRRRGCCCCCALFQRRHCHLCHRHHLCRLLQKVFVGFFFFCAYLLLNYCNFSWSCCCWPLLLFYC